MNCIAATGKKKKEKEYFGSVSRNFTVSPEHRQAMVLFIEKG